MTSNKWDVIVVGAGIAGLTAAAVARRAGKRVLVYEARDRVGGRARTHEVADGVVDMGSTWFWPNERLIAELVEQHGVQTFDQYTADDVLLEASATEIQRLAGNPIDTPALRFTGGAQQLARRLADLLPS